MFLSPDTPFYGVVKKGKSQYFESLLLPGEPAMTLLKQSDSENIDFFISTDPKNKYPSQESYTKTTRNSITLEACEATKTLGCPVYIAVSSNEDQKDTSYALGMRQDSSVIALEDGREIESIFPTVKKTPALFYYHAVRSQNSVVTVNCPGREMIIYAKRIKVNTESLEKFEIKPLDEKTAEFTSANEGAVSVSVPPLIESDLTIIAVSVYLKDPEGSQSTFKILASSQITQLSIGTPYTGFLAKDHYVYFMANVMRPQPTLLISLTIHDENEHNDEGNSGFVLSYGQDTRPTISNYQFASISHSKTHVIEINSMDISLGNSMSGNWIIGVYGHTASPFKLTAIYEDRKIVDLQPGGPVEMSLEESSFVYFKFLHKLPRNLQINLLKFSGQLNLYVTSIDLNQDLVTNLPDQSNSKWQIFRVSPKSVITIPIQDQKACVSCLYIMKIEAISLSKFSLVVNELENIVPLQDGLENKGRLKPEESAIFMLKTSSKTHEAKLKIEMNGNKLIIVASLNPEINLENYLYKEILTSKNSSQVLSFRKSFDNSKAISDDKSKRESQRDSFYILLNNPTNMPLDYSFTMASEKYNIFMPDMIDRIYHLNPLDKSSFLYSEIKEAEIELDIVFYVDRKEGDYKEEFLEFDLRQGQKNYAKCWPEGPGSKSEQEVYLEARAPPNFRRNSSHIIAEQRFITKSQKGAYWIDIFNPWEFSVEYRIYIRPAYTEKVQLNNENSQVESPLGFGETKFYSMSGAGKWYFWVYSCEMVTDLMIKNGDLETGMATIPKGGSYFYKETVTSEPRDVLLSANPYHSNLPVSKFIMYSSVIDEEKFRDYDVKEDRLGIEVSYEEKDEKNKAMIEFNPVEFKDPELTDRITYKVWLCPDISQRYLESPLCSKNYEKCRSSSQDFTVNKKEAIKVEFEGIDSGMYFVKIVVVIEHKDQLIKALEPYIVSYLYIKGSIFWQIFKVFVGVEVLVAVIFLCWRRYVKKKKEQRGIELQKVGKGYNPLEREDTENLEISKGDIGEIEIISPGLR